MRLLYISNVKPFMNALLKSGVFDGFEARGATMRTFTRFDISCVRESAKTPGEGEKGVKAAYCLWGEVRELAYALLKGKTPPAFIKISLCLSGDAAAAIHTEAAALHITITYENGAVTALTGASQKEFSLDKEMDKAWDGYVGAFFAKNGFETGEGGA